MLKWRLLLTTVPWVLLVVAIRLLLGIAFGVKGYVDFGDISPVVTAGAFLMGFMLAGTMSDYKESEKLPAEVALALEGIEDAMVMASNKAGLDLKALRGHSVALSDTIRGWLSRNQTTKIQQVHEGLANMITRCQEMDKAGAGPYAARAAAEVHALRKAVTRIDVISQTGFLASGYAILEVMVLMIIFLLMISRFKSAIAEYSVITSMTLLYIYLIRLIRDIDDPFDYAPNNERRGAAEVDLAPLERYADRLRGRR